MVFDCILGDCQIVSTDNKKSVNKETGREFEWSEVVFVQGTNVNTMTCSKDVKDLLVLGSRVDLHVEVSERYQKGGTKSHKFKVVGFFDDNEDFKK